MRKISRLFVITTRFDAYAVTFALAAGAMERGKAYLVHYPGWGGWLLFLACSASVLMAGAKILDAVRLSETISESTSGLAAVGGVLEPSSRPRANERDNGGGLYGQGT